jgi:hypothetical protein
VPRTFRINDDSKTLGELTPADVDHLRRHPDPDAAADPAQLEQLAEDMRRGGAAKVDDLGREAADRWARTIGIIPKF